MLRSYQSDLGGFWECRGAPAPDPLLTDVIMPDIAGPQRADAARLLRPQLPVLYMSGYTAGSLPGGRTLTDDPLLRKPLSTDELLHHLRQALRRTRALS
jgi:CheY-like chemotaxis protein